MVIRNTTIKDSEGKLIRGVSQWDINRVIKIGGLNLSDPPIIHMWNANSEQATVLESTIDSGDVVIQLPNEFLTEDIDLIVNVCVATDTELRTIVRLIIPVSKCPKPTTYDSDLIQYSPQIVTDDNQGQG
jgi:hypothetical protein